MQTKAKKELLLLESNEEELEGNDDDETIEFEVLTYPANYSMLEISRYINEEIITIPSFQRKNTVWNRKGQSRLRKPLKIA